MAHDVPPAMNLRDMAARYGITLKKGLGQNLLLDDNMNRIMVDAAALTPEDAVIEVGAGLGALTRRIVARAGRVLCVEIDATFVPALNDQFGAMPHVSLFRGDILNHNLTRLTEEYLPGAEHLKLVSNLPYYITTPILFHFLEAPLHFERLVVMMQEEVALRIVAPVGAENYGVLSVASRLHADVDIVHRVPASCFVPKPKVDSAIVRFRCRPTNEAELAERRFILKVVRAAFSQRRKTLQNVLTKSGGFGAPKEAVIAALEEAGIDPGRRPQTLDAAEFTRLAQCIKSRL